jgi:hypothetical protein
VQSPYPDDIVWCESDGNESTTLESSQIKIGHSESKNQTHLVIHNPPAWLVAWVQRKLSLEALGDGTTMQRWDRKAKKLVPCNSRGVGEFAVRWDPREGEQFGSTGPRHYCKQKDDISGDLLMQFVARDTLKRATKDSTPGESAGTVAGPTTAATPADLD